MSRSVFSTGQAIRLTWLMFCLIILVSGFQSRGQQVQRRYSQQAIGNQWRWSYGDSALWHQPSFDDRSWPVRKAEGYWRDIKGRMLTIRQWIVLPANLRTTGNDSLIFDLGYIDDVDVTYLNGKPIGRAGTYPPCESAWNKRRRYKVAVIDTLVKWGKPNLLSIRIWNQGNAGGLWGSAPVVYIPQPQLKFRVNWPIGFKGLAIAKSGLHNLRLTIENFGTEPVTGQAVVNIYPKRNHAATTTTVQDILVEPNTSKQLRISTLITKNDHYMVSFKLVTNNGVWADSSVVLVAEAGLVQSIGSVKPANDSLALFRNDSLIKIEDGFRWYGPDSWLPLAEQESDTCGWRGQVTNELRMRSVLAHKLPNNDLSNHLLALLAIKLKSGWLSADDRLKLASGIGMAEYWQHYNYEHNAILAHAALASGTKTGLDLAEMMVNEWLTYWGPESSQLHPNVVLGDRTSELALLLMPTMALYGQTNDNKYLQFGRFIIRQIDGSGGNKLLSQLLAKEPIEPFLAKEPVKLLLTLRGLNLAAQYADNPVWQQAVDYAYQDLSRHFVFDARKRVRRSFISLETMIEWHYLSLEMATNPNSTNHLETGRLTILPESLVRLLLNELTQRPGLELEKQLVSLLYAQQFYLGQAAPAGSGWYKVN